MEASHQRPLRPKPSSDKPRPPDELVDLTADVPVIKIRSDPSRIPLVVSSKLPRELQIVHSRQATNYREVTDQTRNRPTAAEIKHLLAQQLQRQRKNVAATNVVARQPLYFEQMKQAAKAQVVVETHSSNAENSAKMDYSENHVQRQGTKNSKDFNMADQKIQLQNETTSDSDKEADKEKQDETTQCSPMLFKVLSQERLVQRVESEREKKLTIVTVHLKRENSSPGTSVQNQSEDSQAKGSSSVEISEDSCSNESQFQTEKHSDEGSVSVPSPVLSKPSCIPSVVEDTANDKRRLPKTFETMDVDMETDSS